MEPTYGYTKARPTERAVGVQRDGASRQSGCAGGLLVTGADRLAAAISRVVDKAVVCVGVHGGCAHLYAAGS